MPTYEYECGKCGKFEKFQSMKDEPLKKCPKCKGNVTRLLGTGSGIIFKGSGFYQTDYKNKASGSCHKPKSDGCKGCPSSH
ncbi:MAG: zinc ribbon domain-containing protein [Candidatus Omnitrophica bacterium]|nr:zinc ribbon domain-containing protein [Candidatus Omnitrophota bacterium]